MTNEQLCILLKLYRERLLQINETCKDYTCCKDGLMFSNEIDRLSTEIYNDMKRLGFSAIPAKWTNKPRCQ